MKKIVTSIRKIEKTYCDVCGEEIDGMCGEKKCEVCGNDLCYRCYISVSNSANKRIMCITHLDTDGQLKMTGE